MEPPLILKSQSENHAARRRVAVRCRLAPFAAFVRCPQRTKFTRRFFVRFRANDDALKLERGLRAALDKTAVAGRS